MSHPILPLIIILILLFAAAVFVLYLGWRKQQARIAAWAEFASRHDMFADRLLIEGAYEGYPLRLETQTRSSDKHRYTVTVLRLSTQGALPPEFSLEEEGLGDKLLKLVGKGDAEIGDEAFDRLFDLKNLSPAAARVLQNKTVRQHLYEMVVHYRSFHIRAGWIQAEHRSIPSTVDELEEFTGPALLLVHVLEEASQRTQGWTAS